MPLNEWRIGVNMMNPEVALDINGVFRVQDKLNFDEISNGVLYRDGVENSFYGRKIPSGCHYLT